MRQIKLTLLYNTRAKSVKEKYAETLTKISPSIRIIHLGNIGNKTADNKAIIPYPMPISAAKLKSKTMIFKADFLLELSALLIKERN